MRTIEVDFDIHKRIELERRGFGESANTVLRRLLGLPNSEVNEFLSDLSKVSGWHGEGVSLPPRTLVRMRYNGRSHEGQIVGNVWLVEGQEHHSPSGAASAVARTKAGKPTKLNGWNYWEVKLPDKTEWQEIMDLYRAANPSIGAEELLSMLQSDASDRAAKGISL